MRQLFCLGREADSGSRAEALFDGACFDARCHIKCYFSSNFFCQKSWKKCWILLNSNFLSKFFCPKSWKKVGHDATRQNRVAVRVFEGKKSSIVRLIQGSIRSSAGAVDAFTVSIMELFFSDLSSYEYTGC